ncbi:MAG TPA: hypothetical protein PK874_10925 [Desulfobacteraceae bacterium]|nr:hypothetical protein [Desulfobacteraceae bacterium]
MSKRLDLIQLLGRANHWKISPRRIYVNTGFAVKVNWDEAKWHLYSGIRYFTVLSTIAK